MAGQSRGKVDNEFKELIIKPEAGTVLGILSGLSFLLLGMLLPLVGKAGAATYHYTANFITFLFLLLIATAFSGLNLYSRLERRKLDNSPYPKLSLALCIACGVIFLSLIFGLLKI